MSAITSPSPDLLGRPDQAHTERQPGFIRRAGHSFVELMRRSGELQANAGVTSTPGIFEADTPPNGIVGLSGLRDPQVSRDGTHPGSELSEHITGSPLQEAGAEQASLGSVELGQPSAAPVPPAEQPPQAPAA